MVRMSTRARRAAHVARQVPIAVPMIVAMSDRDEAGEQRELAAVEQAGEHVAALLVGAEEVAGAERSAAAGRSPRPTSGSYGAISGANTERHHDQQRARRARRRRRGCVRKRRRTSRQYGRGSMAWSAAHHASRKDSTVGGDVGAPGRRGHRRWRWRRTWSVVDGHGISRWSSRDGQATARRRRGSIVACADVDQQVDQDEGQRDDERRALHDQEVARARSRCRRAADARASGRSSR